MQLVSIVLAIYRPNQLYFKKLLDSINNQTYPNIEIIIRDDSDDMNIYTENTKLIKESIKNFEYDLFQNRCNLGSNKTFELLTKSTNGAYIAYCDQDDIWEKDKIMKLVEKLEEENSVMCYSDLSIIDGNDVIIAKSFKDVNKRVNHMFGENLFRYFLRRNSVTGCTMIIKSEIARKAIPFCHEFYVHDHWLTLFASTQGKISYMKQPLIRYRLHGNNQIGASMLNGINSKKDYIDHKLKKELKRYEYLLNRYKFSENEKGEILAFKRWTEIRISFFEKKRIRDCLSMIKNIKEDWQLTIFELYINFVPRKVASKTIEIFKK